ncbi:hypothetical protein CHARACLAT_014173 [Characodon lateralis]|uniref:Uncharacterized protein n=1 Tax=Characodon lateralis TaxID=208331 RepID=A0ABU7E4I2_9TELE|nr:hypothetical protein [Characodon lateralis]
MTEYYHHLFVSAFGLKTVRHPIDQRCPKSVLKGQCPACFRCFPALTHLIQVIAVQQKPVNQAWMEIRCAGAGNHLKHAGHLPSRTDFAINTISYERVLLTGCLEDKKQTKDQLSYRTF